MNCSSSSLWKLKEGCKGRLWAVLLLKSCLRIPEGEEGGSEEVVDKDSLPPLPALVLAGLPRPGGLLGMSVMEL